MFWGDSIRRLERAVADADYQLAKIRRKVCSHRASVCRAHDSSQDVDSAVVDRGVDYWNVPVVWSFSQNGISAGSTTDYFLTNGRGRGSETLAGEQGRDQWENERASARRNHDSSGSKLMELKEILLAAISAVASGIAAWFTALRKYRAEALKSQLEERKLYIQQLTALMQTMNQEIAEYKAEILSLRDELQQARSRIFELEGQIAELKREPGAK